MKSLLIILITMCSFCVFGQNLTLYSYSPERLCACDSVKILLKWKQGSYPVNLNISNIQTNQTSTILNRILSPVDFSKMDKFVNGFDTVYTFYLKMPCNITSMQPHPNSDAVLVEIAFGTEVNNIYVTVTDCVSGIEEYSLDTQEPVYFDLYGNKIEKRANEIIIKQVGYKRVKIRIDE